MMRASLSDQQLISLYLSGDEVAFKTFEPPSTTSLFQNLLHRSRQRPGERPVSGHLHQGGEHAQEREI